MLFTYILIELILLGLIISSSINGNDQLLIDIFKFMPIAINLLFSFSKKINIKLRLILLVTVVADFFFLFFNNCVLGISIFILVQSIYFMYLNKKNNILLITCSLINILCVVLFYKKLIIFEGIIYSILTFINIYKSYKLSKEDKRFKLISITLICLFVCDLSILLKYIFKLGVVFEIIEWIFYILSQVLLVIYSLDLDDAFLYRFLQPIFRFIFKIYYNPTIINKEYIPKNGRCVIAGNHKHALDPIFVDTCTKRIVHTLAKKDLHDGKFGWFFKSIGTIPVDLHAKHNKAALDSAIEFLNNESLINLSPEAKRNYTKEVLLPFKYGAVVMAKRTNSKIVPYSITGDYKFRSKNLKIVFGKPLDISKLSIEEANELLFKKVKKLILDNRK